MGLTVNFFPANHEDHGVPMNVAVGMDLIEERNTMHGIRGNSGGNKAILFK